MWWHPVLDAIVVIVFVVIGRETHNEGNAFVAISETAAPFLIGLGVGWAILLARHAAASRFAAIVVWAATLVVGMILRRTAFDDGTAVSFVIVAGLFLGAGMLGWRFAWRRMAARRN